MNTIDTYPNDSEPLNLSRLILWVLGLKLLLFLIDPTAMFFIDDSTRYLDTAVSSYIPPDRSFLYGFVIRWVTWGSRSLTSLVLFQVLCSAATAVMAGVILNRCLSVRRTVAAVFSMLCAVAPLQLLYERYVLTETVSLFFFALFVATALHYLKRPKITTLFLLGLSGVILIALRLSYLPTVKIGAIAVPCLGFFSLHPGGGERVKGIAMKKSPARRILITCLHLFFSCLVTFVLHSGYKALNGRLSDKPPAYQYCTGFHLLSSWAPLLEKEDYADPAMGHYNDFYISFSLKDRFQRINHRWSYYGLTGYLCRLYGSRTKADEVARATARNILRRDPWGIAGLAFRSYLDYWNPTLLKQNLRVDRSVRKYSDTLLEMLKSKYHLLGEDLRSRKTLSNQYFLHAIPWYWVLFSLPLVIVLTILTDRKAHLIPLLLLGGFGLLIMINSTALIHRLTLRFFHPDEWMTIIFLGVFVDRIMIRKAGEKETGDRRQETE